MNASRSKIKQWVSDAEKKNISQNPRGNDAWRCHACQLKAPPARGVWVRFREGMAQRKKREKGQIGHPNKNAIETLARAPASWPHSSRAHSLVHLCSYISLRLNLFKFY